MLTNNMNNKYQLLLDIYLSNIYGYNYIDFMFVTLYCNYMRS